MLGHVPDVQSLDVRALLAQLVGSVQALSARDKALSAENRAQAARIAALEAALRVAGVA